jgi:hypothetical protein
MHKPVQSLQAQEHTCYFCRRWIAASDVAEVIYPAGIFLHDGARDDVFGGAGRFNHDQDDLQKRGVEPIVICSRCSGDEPSDDDEEEAEVT